MTFNSHFSCHLKSDLSVGFIWLLKMVTISLETSVLFTGSNVVFCFRDWYRYLMLSEALKRSDLSQLVFSLYKPLRALHVVLLDSKRDQRQHHFRSKKTHLPKPGFSNLKICVIKLAQRNSKEHAVSRNQYSLNV